MKLDWVKLKGWACNASLVPGGVLLHSEGEASNYGGREALCFIPMVDDLAKDWLKKNKEKPD